MASTTFTLWRVLVIFYLVIIPQTLTQQVETNPELLVVRSMKSIGAALNYLMDRESSIDTDELLGLRVAAASLLTTIENCMESPKMSVPKTLIDELKTLCARFNVLIPRIINIYKPATTLEGFKQFIAVKLKGFRSYRAIQVDKQDRTKLQSLEGIELQDFQACLGDLNEKNASSCTISKQCWRVLQPKIAKGPNLPYQAMILVMVELLGCSSEINQKWSAITIEDLADNICYSLYPKISSFHSNEISQETEEIASFLESFFACSLLGFEDFLHVTHMRIPAVIQWQFPSGCFGLKKSESDKAFTETCILRMSSAAVGQLGLYLRWLMDPKGYTALTGTQPFPSSSSWFIPLIILLAILILALFFMRRARRLVWNLIGKFIAFFTSVKK